MEEVKYHTLYDFQNDDTFSQILQTFVLPVFEISRKYAKMDCPNTLLNLVIFNVVNTVSHLVLTCPSVDSVEDLIL